MPTKPAEKTDSVEQTDQPQAASSTFEPCAVCGKPLRTDENAACSRCGYKPE